MVDHKKIEKAVRLLLEGIGEDVTREGLADTPDRIARMYEEIYKGMAEDPAEHLSRTFAVESNEIVLEKDITFYSTCEHHLMPFYGKAHIAYLPDGRVVGLSKLARTVEVYARRLQGVMVMLEAEHMCMTMRGVAKPGSRTITTAARGCFAEEMKLQQYFFEMIKR